MSTYETLTGLLSIKPQQRISAIRKANGVDGLYAIRTCLLQDPDATVRAAAAERLGELGDTRACPWLVITLYDRAMIVREQSCRALVKTGDERAVAKLKNILRNDDSWRVRRAAVAAMLSAGVNDATTIETLRSTLDDPAWRVRYAVVQALAVLARDESKIDQVLAPLVDAPMHAESAFQYLNALVKGSETTIRSLQFVHEATSTLADPDPAVVTARLIKSAEGEHHPLTLVQYLADPHVWLRREAIKRLARSGSHDAMRAALEYFVEPRTPHAIRAVHTLIRRAPAVADDVAQQVIEHGGETAIERWAQQRFALDTQAAEEAPELVVDAGGDDPMQRISFVSESDSLSRLQNDANPSVRRVHLTYLLRRNISEPTRETAVRWASQLADGWCRTLAATMLQPSNKRSDLETLVRLARDEDLGVRAAVNDVLDDSPFIYASIEELIDHPENLSENELRGAALLLATHAPSPIEFLSQLAQHTTERAQQVVSSLVRDLTTPAVVAPKDRGKFQQAKTTRRVLGSTGISVSSLGVSGAYNPSPKALRKAEEAGVNLFFWEPSYTNLTRYLRRGERRAERVIVAGTYHADAVSIEADVNRALKRLNRDALDVFLLFWVRSPSRIDDEALTVLEKLKTQGKIRAHGISTHHRDLAADYVERHLGDVIMVRHNAAHRGAEEKLFPLALKHNIGVISFSALCYGRMIKRAPGATVATPKASECYRYSNTQPGVTATWSAPRRVREIEENLQALDAVPLTEERVAELRQHGDAVYRGSQQFNAWVRQAPAPTRELVRPMAIDLLDSQPEAPPDTHLAAVSPREMLREISFTKES